MAIDTKRVPVGALVVPPVVVFGSMLLSLVEFAIFTAVVGIVIEGFAVPVAVTALIRNVALRTAGNVVAILVGAGSLVAGIMIVVVLAGGM